jgi:hypothetical protein
MKKVTREKCWVLLWLLLLVSPLCAVDALTLTGAWRFALDRDDKSVAEQ